MSAGYALLSPHQAAVAAAFLAERAEERRHVVVYLSGAHAYGFPSPDSDLDLKAIHAAPAEDLLRLTPRLGGSERTEFREGVELDYSSNELGDALRGCLRGNGNYLERLLGGTTLVEDPRLATLRPLLLATLSRRVYHHYRGFAATLAKEAAAKGTAKKFLYVYRAALTGIHALRAGEIVTDVRPLAERYDAPIGPLLARKATGETAPLDEGDRARWLGRFDDLFTRLEEARAASPLPEEAPATEDLDRWLLAARLPSAPGGQRTPSD